MSRRAGDDGTKVGLLIRGEIATIFKQAVLLDASCEMVDLAVQRR